MLLRYLSSCCLFVALFSVVGCGEGDKFNRQAVSGTISYDGKPLPFGNIEFAPENGQPTNLILEVKAGKFDAKKEFGLAPGKYTIRVQGTETAPLPPKDVPGDVPPPKTLVPDKYNAASKETIEIKVGDANELKIDLKK